MQPKRRGDRHQEAVEDGLPQPQSALPGKGGLARIVAAFWNSLGGFREGLSTEIGDQAGGGRSPACWCRCPSSSPSDLWTWVALIASLLFVLSVEFMNTAIERLCNHIQPGRHEAIRITKDLASAAVFFSLRWRRSSGSRRCGRASPA